MVLHDLIDDPTGSKLASTIALHPHLGNGFFNNFIGGVEVKLLALLIVLFLAEALNHETVFSHINNPLFVINIAIIKQKKFFIHSGSFV
jgi:hypothetical protein